MSVESTDDGAIIDNPNISAGDTVRLHHIGMDGLSSTANGSYDFIIMAKVRTNENTATTRNTGSTRFYLPTENYLSLCDQPHLVSFPFNVKAGAESQMGDFLNSYIDSVEPSMDFASKETYVNSFDSLTSLIITIGGALSIIIGIIGIANFVNSILTSVITRKKEFAMLQSIGMTGKQLKRMLSFEGLYYAVGTIITSVILLASVISMLDNAAPCCFNCFRLCWPWWSLGPCFLASKYFFKAICSTWAVSFPVFMDNAMVF